MKKICCLTIVLLFLFSTYSGALSWAYAFVVHDGKVYEVKEDLPINQTELGTVIGKVETKPNEQSGDYYGNASNYYEIGTRYFEITEVSTNQAIAVELEKDHFVKAVYVHDAPLNSKYNFTMIWYILGFGIVLLVGITVIKSKQS